MTSTIFRAAGLSCLALFLVGLTPSNPALAQLKLCALRSGPNGPCTCKGPNDGAGEFTAAPRSRCGRTDVKPPADAAATTAPPAAAAPEATPPAKAPDAATPPPSSAETKREAPPASETQEAAPVSPPAAPPSSAETKPEAAPAADAKEAAPVSPPETPPPSAETKPEAAPAAEAKETAPPSPTADPQPAAQETPPPPTSPPETAQPATQENAPSAPAPPDTTGAIPQVAPAASPGATLLEVRARGKVVCGVNGDLVGFSYRSDTGDWLGLDVDFCRAVAAAALADASKAEFVVVGTEDRFDVLKSGKIDLLTRNTTWNMSREADLGLEFPGVLYYDGQSITTKQESGLVSAQQLGGLRICVLSNTTSEKNLRYYFSAIGMTADIAALPEQAAIMKEYEAGSCAAYSGDRSALFSERLRLNDPAAHAVLPEVISKEPLGPVVRTGDAQWAKIVRWTLAGLVNAEEVGLAQQTLKSNGALSEDAERLVAGAGTAGKSLGLDEAWLKNVILGVGNYADIFERNLGGGSPLGMERGINALWKKGGILFAPPMW